MKQGELRALVVSAALLLSAGCGGGPAAVPDSGIDGSLDGDVMPPDGAPADRALPDGTPADRTLPDDATVDAFSDASRPDAGDDSMLVRDLFCGPLARAVCRVPWDCRCPDVGSPPDDVDGCVAMQTSACMTLLYESELGAGLRSGLATVDRATLERCATRVEASYASCSAEQADVLAFCVTGFVDVASLGESCASGALVCAGGAGYCDESWRCAALPGAGMACAEPLGLCARGLACRRGTCHALGGPDAACERDSECADGLLCVAGRCQAMRTPIGGSCRTTGECVAGARCVAGVCTPHPAGASCVTVADCGALEACTDRFEPRCTPVAMLGDRCTHVHGCVPEGYCDFELGICRPRPEVGEPCTITCVTGATCGLDGVCHPLSGEGEPCTPNLDSDGCVDGLACVAGICSPPPAFGEVCGDGGECAFGLECFYDSGGEPTCRSPREIGEPCADAADGNGCREEAYCDLRADLCTPRRGGGEPCEGGDCEPGLDCIVDEITGSRTCAPIPRLGERCFDLCEEGSVCTYVRVDSRCEPTVCYNLPTF